MACRLSERYLAPRRAIIASVIRRGVEAGQLRADIDVEMAIDMMVGAAVYRWLATAQPVDRTPAAASSTRSGSPCERRARKRALASFDTFQCRQ